MLKLYEEQQGKGNLKLLEELRRHSKVMLKQCIDGAEQRSVTSYFTGVASTEATGREGSNV